jgi:hypothetical protein
VVRWLSDQRRPSSHQAFEDLLPNKTDTNLNADARSLRRRCCLSCLSLRRDIEDPASSLANAFASVGTSRSLRMPCQNPADEKAPPHVMSLPMPLLSGLHWPCVLVDAANARRCRMLACPDCEFDREVAVPNWPCRCRRLLVFQATQLVLLQWGFPSGNHFLSWSSLQTRSTRPSSQPRLP